jgi:hypothetical protein
MQDFLIETYKYSIEMKQNILQFRLLMSQFVKIPVLMNLDAKIFPCNIEACNRI